MPVREKALETALHELLRDASYFFINNPGNPIANLNGVEMPKEEFDRRFWEPIERIFERVVDAIDWNRVMLEAAQRHEALAGTEGHEKCEKFVRDNLLTNEITSLTFGPECLCEALLCDETHSDWKLTPKAPRYHTSSKEEA